MHMLVLMRPLISCLFFFFNDTATTEIYTLSLHDALPILPALRDGVDPNLVALVIPRWKTRSEEHTSELQSLRHLVCRLLLEKKKQKQKPTATCWHELGCRRGRQLVRVCNKM